MAKNEWKLQAQEESRKFTVHVHYLYTTQKSISQFERKPLQFFYKGKTKANFCSLSNQYLSQTGL